MASVPDFAALVPGLTDFIKEAALTTDNLSKEVVRLTEEIQQLTAKAASATPPVLLSEEQATKLASLLVEREMVLPEHQTATAAALRNDPVKVAATLEALLTQIPGAPSSANGSPTKIVEKRTPTRWS